MGNMFFKEEIEMVNILPSEIKFDSMDESQRQRQHQCQELGQFSERKLASVAATVNVAAAITDTDTTGDAMKSCCFCLRKDHITTEHYCSICGAIGQHSAKNCHIYCDFCHKHNHPTEYHMCRICGIKGHHDTSSCLDALYMMCQMSNFKGIRRLRVRGYKFDTRCLIESVDQNSNRMMQMILASNDLTCVQILSVALEYQSVEWVKDILDAYKITKRDLNNFTEKNLGELGLQLALDYRDEELGLMFLELEADPNMTTMGPVDTHIDIHPSLKTVNPILYYVVNEKLEDFSIKLVESGAFLDLLFDNNRYTLFDYAKKLKMLRLADVIIKMM